LFKNYSSSSFFSQWQQLEAQQEKRELSSLVTFHFQS